MASFTSQFTGERIRAAAQYSDTRAPAEGDARPPHGNPLDVWSHSWDALTKDVGLIAERPSRLITEPVAYVGDLGNAIGEGVMRDQNRQSLDGAVDSTVAQLDALGDKASKIADADGALATVGATFDFLTATEQLLSTPFSILPSVALPALRISDMDFGMPHAHAHPPNLTPFGLISLPSTGPVIPIPIFSGAQRTLINGLPAARCGDLGLGIWCGSFVPMFEVFLGSSSVWIEGARAARMGIDITNHCIFTVRPRPSDPPIGSFNGTTYTGSPNVIIGGTPMPSLLSLAIGQLFKLMFVGAAKLIGKLRPAKELVEEAAEVVDEVAEAADEAGDFADEVTDVVPRAVPPGNAIDNILSGFSDAVRDLVRLSPTLRRQVEGLDNAKWTIIRGNAGRSFCDSRRGVIVVASHGDNAGGEVGMLAHEVGHAYYTKIPEVPPNGLTREQYVDANVGRYMADEGAAQFNAAKVSDELGQAGHNAPIPGENSQRYADIYEQHKAGTLSEEEAMHDMGDLMRNEIASGSNKPYPETYGEYYNQQYDEFERANAPDSGSTMDFDDPADTNPFMPAASDTIPDMPAASDTIPGMPAQTPEPSAGDTLPGVGSSSSGAGAPSPGSTIPGMGRAGS